MFAGWITFSAFEDGDAVVAQAQVLMRAQDPIGELGLTFGGHGKENTFWEQTLAGAGRVARRAGRRRLDAGRVRRSQAPVVAREERASLGRDPLDAAHDEARQALATARKEQARSAVPTGEGRPTALLTSLCTSQPGRVVAEVRDGTRTRLRGAGRWTCTRPGLGWILTSPGPLVVPPWAAGVVVGRDGRCGRRRGVGRRGGGRGARARGGRRDVFERLGAGLSDRRRARVRRARRVTRLLREADVGRNRDRQQDPDDGDDDQQLGQREALVTCKPPQQTVHPGPSPSSCVRPSRRGLTMRTKRARRYWPSGWAGPTSSRATRGSDRLARSRARRSGAGCVFKRQHRLLALACGRRRARPWR